MRTDLRVLRPKDAAAKVGLSRMHLYRLEKSGRFPKRIHLGEASVGWLEHEIDSWLAERIAERDAGTTQAPPEPVAPPETSRPASRDKGGKARRRGNS